MGNGESAFTKCPGGVAVAEAGAGLPMDADEMAKLKLRAIQTRETPEARLERYIRDLQLTPEKLHRLVDAFIDELQLGLALHRDSPGGVVDPKKCSFKMLDSHVKNLPLGTEVMTSYAIDFGGSNFRAVRLELKGNGKIETQQYTTSLTAPENSKHPHGLMDKNATATEMFDFFALTMKKFMQEMGDLDKGETFGVGFTFSFPASQYKLSSANLMVWTKEFETGRNTNDPVENRDVGELLEAAFKRNGVPMTLNAVCNDTVGTLLSASYEKEADKPPCLIGIILGTGANACYYEESCPFHNYNGNIVNIECGNFNRELPRTSIDMEADFMSSNRGSQLLEKMISGAYLGEICRRTILKVARSEAPEGAWKHFSLTSEDAATIAADESPEATVAHNILKERWGADLTPSQCMAARRICFAVFDRGAGLAACIIAACAKKTGKLQHAMGGLTCAVDGSLYKCNKFYRKRLRHYLTEILDESSSLIHMVLADDGSGKGAGVCR